MASETEIPANTGARRAEARKFITFLVTGGVAAVCNLVARALLSKVTSYGVSVAIAYVVGMIVAYVLAKLFVFESGGRRWQAELSRFAVVNAVSFAQVWLVSVGLERYVLPRLHWVWHPELCAHMVGVASPVVVSYFAHKHFTFSAAEAEIDPDAEAEPAA